MKPSVQLVAFTMPATTADYPEAFGLPAVAGLHDPLEVIEMAGRWDYGPKSVSKMSGDPSAIIGRWLKSGEESMLEMVDVVLLWTCSRVVSHELVRHRIASYQQESQRFVKYDEETVDSLFFIPPELDGDGGSPAEQAMTAAYLTSLEAYNELRRQGVAPQIARYVLPNATRTRITVKANLREWRHILRLRVHSSAQPEMRVLAQESLDILRTLFPVVFEDITGEERAAR